jgi:integrase
VKISERTVKSLSLPEQGNSIHYDDELTGFGVRITAAGAVAFILNYRVAGRERRITIGRHPEWSAEAARTEALNLKHEIRNRRDPLVAREKEHGEPLFADLARDYMEIYALKNKRASSVRNDRQMLERIILPKLGRLRVIAVGQRDIEILHGSLKATPYRANRVLSLLSKMFNLAIEWKLRADNPAKNVERYHEDTRETWLDMGQLRRLEAALTRYPDPEAADALRLLILTGARTGEVLKAEWPQFDLERGVWTKLSHHTKQQKIEHVPLSRVALVILRDMAKRSSTSHLFPGKHGARVTLRRPWMQVLRSAGLADAVEKNGKRVWKPKVRIHDLRHTFASHLVSRGESLHKVGKLLGHTSPQTTARYAHVDDRALRDTTNNFVYRRLKK